MIISNEKFQEIEDDIDNWLFNILDERIPRYKYIYHMNLVFIDYIVDQKMWFTNEEKDFVFSLSYNTYLAYKKLNEEENFSYKFDLDLYRYCYSMLIRGFQYSKLCNVFPLVHSKEAIINVDENSEAISIRVENMPRRNRMFFCNYRIRKSLSYTLQMSLRAMEDKTDEDAALKLADVYIDFFNENMLSSDFETYSIGDWGGITLFFIIAAMRRFVKIYRSDFDMEIVDSQKSMIIFSPNRVNEMKEYAISGDHLIANQVLQDYIYKPLGNTLFPKSDVSDAPIIKTKDGYMFINPIVLLFNSSMETRLLNYLRKYDNNRHQIIKDKLKERAIPLINEMINIKYPDVKIISNFELRIPNTKKRKRELDILIVDNSGFVLYIEIKHFFNPISSCEMRNVDSQFNEALNKMPEQLKAISENWSFIKERYNISTNMNQLNGIIVSHQYVGCNVKLDENIPLVDTPTLFESISNANTIEEIYNECKETDYLHSTIKLINQDIEFSYSKYKFNLELEALDPSFEMVFREEYKKTIYKSINLNKREQHDNIHDVAQEYLNRMSD